MHSVLTELFYGNINPHSSNNNENTAYKDAMKLLSQIEHDLLPLLEGESKRLFNRFAEAYGELNDVVALEKFSFGFRLGAALMGEVLAGQQTLVS